MANLAMRPAVQGQLAPVEARPGRELSWYNEAGNSAEKEACMVRLDVLVSIRAPGALRATERFLYFKENHYSTRYRFLLN